MSLFAANPKVCMLSGCAALLALSASVQATPFWHPTALELSLRPRSDSVQGDDTRVMVQLRFALDRPPRPRHPRTDGLAAAPEPDEAWPGAARSARTPAPVPTALLRRTLQQAYRAAGLGLSDRQIASALRRARMGALLPELRLRGVQFAGYDSVLYEQRATSNRDQMRDTRMLEGVVSWRLDRLAYGPDEPQLESLRTRRAELRLRLLQQVLSALSTRQAALWALAQAEAEADPAARAQAMAQQQEAEMLLDALTDGAFSAGACDRPCPLSGAASGSLE